jgi:hypothetical protein
LAGGEFGPWLRQQCGGDLRRDLARGRVGGKGDGVDVVPTASATGGPVEPEAWLSNIALPTRQGDTSFWSDL